jgi:hypothetical protein
LPWHAVIDDATGRLVSLGQVVADPLPAGLVAQDLPGRPADSQMWDEATRSFVPRPPKVLVDRIQDLADDPALVAVWTRLTAVQRTALRNRLVQLLGPHRFRSQSTPVDLGSERG